MGNSVSDHGAVGDFQHPGGDEEQALISKKKQVENVPSAPSKLSLILVGIVLGFFLGLLYTTLVRILTLGGGESEYSLNFLVLGDWGRNGFYNQSLVAAQMGRVGERLDVDFVISVGDNFYNTGLTGTDDPKFTTSFTSIYTAPSLQKPWYTVLGNHDYMGDALAQLNQTMTQRDSRWYCRREFELRRFLCGEKVAGDLKHASSCKSSVDIIFIDTTPFIDDYWMANATQTFDWRGLAPRQHQLDSQLQRLDRLLSASEATWKIVVGHHTMHSFGHHGDSVELLSSVLPILEAHNVDLYINGHDHCLEHIKHSDSKIHFITSGAGSKAWQGIRPATVENGLHFAYDGQGFVSASVGAKSLRLEFYDAFGNVLHRTHLSRD